jgi:hypothetical protein
MPFMMAPFSPEASPTRRLSASSRSLVVVARYTSKTARVIVSRKLQLSSGDPASLPMKNLMFGALTVAGRQSSSGSLPTMPIVTPRLQNSLTRQIDAARYAVLGKSSSEALLSRLSGQANRFKPSTQGDASDKELHVNSACNARMAQDDIGARRRHRRPSRWERICRTARVQLMRGSNRLRLVWRDTQFSYCVFGMFALTP